MTPKWCKKGCAENVFSTAINGRSTAEHVLSTAENVLSTGCLPSESQATSSTNFGFTNRPDVNILILQCVSPSAESSTPNLHLTFRSSVLPAYGFPTGLPVVCLWCVYGLSMVCRWFVYGVNLP